MISLSKYYVESKKREGRSRYEVGNLRLSVMDIWILTIFILFSFIFLILLFFFFILFSWKDNKEVT